MEISHFSHRVTNKDRGCNKIFMLNSAEHEIKLLINTEIAKINGNFRFKSQKSVIYPANKC